MTTNLSKDPGAGASAPATPPLPREGEAPARRVTEDAFTAGDSAPPNPPPPLRRRGRFVLAGLAALALAAGLVLPRLAVVPDDEMAPSLLAGDLVLLGGGTPTKGEVVAVVDPLDPSRWTLRRVETIGGAIRYEAGVYLTGNTPRTLEMGRDDTYVTRTVDDHLVRLRAREVRWEMEPVGVPDDAAFLGADSRDDAMDSRWWGPLPLAALQGRVLLRIGAPGHPWRSWITTTP